MSADNTDEIEIQWQKFKEMAQQEGRNKFLRSSWRKEAQDSKIEKETKTSQEEEKKVKTFSIKKKNKSQNEGAIPINQLSINYSSSSENFSSNKNESGKNSDSVNNEQNEEYPFINSFDENNFYNITADCNSQTNGNSLSFNLYDKMRYNHILTTEAYIKRFFIIKFKVDSEYLIAKLESFNDNIMQLKVIKTNENINITNYEQVEVYLIEDIFSLTSAENQVYQNYHIYQNYALIVSLFNIDKEKRELMISIKNDYFNTSEVVYSGFLLRENFEILSDLIRLESRNLKFIPSYFSQNSLSFISDLKNSFMNFLQNSEESEQVTKINFAFYNLKDYILYECIIRSLKKICILLKYDDELKSLYVRDYKTGNCEWLDLSFILNEGFSINLIKGPANYRSYVQKSMTQEFFKKLLYGINSQIQLDSREEHLVLLSKSIDDKFILHDAECNKCTYQIKHFPNVICKVCSKIFHTECLPESFREPVKIGKESIWLCLDCRPCENCRDSHKDKLTCLQCQAVYHLNCLNPDVKKRYSNFSDRGKWKCEKCLICVNCSTTKGQFSENYSHCLACEKRFEKNEYCPICKMLWTQQDKNMVECKCKFWVHKQCDRILTDDYFKKLTKKTYHCPPCRIKKKNKILKSILDELIIFDKSNIFYFPVDVNQVKGYTKVVTYPMCFQFIEEKLQKNVYLEFIEEFFNDVILIFANAMSFNRPNSQIYKSAEQAASECQNILDAKRSEIFNLSLDYYIFDHNNFEVLFSKQKKEFLKLLEEKIKNLFSGNLALINDNLILNRLMEFKLEWDFPKVLLLNKKNEVLLDSKTSQKELDVVIPMIEDEPSFDNSSTIIQIKLDSKQVEEIISENPIKEEVELVGCETVLKNVTEKSDDLQNKKRDRGKPKIIKISDFQHELDTYNSNFELKVKDKKNMKETSQKMEINENGDDCYVNESEEEEESNVMKQFSKASISDSSLNYLYPRKYFTFSREEQKAYMEVLASYLILKEEKKKASKKPIESIDIIEEPEEEVDLDEVYNQKKLKKGRPNKLKVEKSLKVKKPRPNEENIDNKFNNSCNSILPSDSNSNRPKPDLELNEESKHSSPLQVRPVVVCFSNINLIMEKNCFLCGSFDDMNLFLTCSICFEHFHSYCISNSSSITNNIDAIKSYQWKCQNCKFCEICKQNTNDSLLLYCDSCDRAIHTYCLDRKLEAVPDSGWKCLACFKCQNCKSTEYYKPNFPIQPHKDYSYFTRNFNFCYECGMRYFYQSLCLKCEKSYFNSFEKTLIFIKNKEDYKVYEAELKERSQLDEKDYILMLYCDLCKCWLHSECIGLDQVNLEYYYQAFDVFRCLDCHMMNKFQDRYLEATYVKYLNVLQMSFAVMSFSKLMMIILKSLCNNTNIKLHSKLLKMFLKEKFDTIIKDKNMSLLLEILRIDVFVNRDKKVAKKKKKENKPIQFSEKAEEIDDPLQENKLIENDFQIPIESDMKIEENDSYLLSRVEKNSETLYPVESKINNEDRGDSVRKSEISKHEKIENDTIQYINTNNCNYQIEERQDFKINSHFDEMDENTNKTLSKIYESVKPEDKEAFSLNKIEDGKNSLAEQKLNLLKKKRKRISFVTDKNLKEKFEKFFSEVECNDIPVKIVDFGGNFVDFYKFELDDFYKSQLDKVGINLNSHTSLETSTVKGGISNLMEKIEPFLTLASFPKRMKNFILQLLLITIIRLKSLLLEWLMTQMKSGSDLKKNELHPLMNCLQKEGSELSEEECTKLLDYVDPLENSPSRNIQCELCLRKGARKLSGRLLYIKNESWAHVNCLVWGKGIHETEEGLLLNATQMVNKVKLFKCNFCRKYGATIICEVKKCGRNFHFACAQLKQCVFSEKKNFYCNRCAANLVQVKEENSTCLTQRKLVVIKNIEFFNETRNVEKLKNIHSKFLIGSFNKYGNTTILKCLQVNRNDLSPESLDLVVMKYIQRETRQNLLFLSLNETGLYFSNTNFNKNNCSELESFIRQMKLENIFHNTEIDLNLLEKVSQESPIVKLGEISTKLVDYSKDKPNILSSPVLKNFNNVLETYLKEYVLNEDEVELSKFINVKYNDWMKFFNIYTPCNVLLKFGPLYIKTYAEYSDIDLKNSKDSQSKVQQYANMIKSKNKNLKNSFKVINYIETHQQKIFKRSTAERESLLEFTNENERKIKTKENNYKLMKRTMSTNIMDMDLPISMKFRNYKSLRPKVTIGPSTIHRNGLFTTESFQPGEIVIEYVGELITNKIADFREKEYNLRGFGDCYMFRLDQNFIIDATKYGNLARFINHCCDPNCSAQANQIGDKKHIILYAKRPIKAHEEITYDYNFECEQEKIMCRCGAQNCLGRLN